MFPEKFLITGATGAFGNACVRRLLEKSPRIVIFSRSEFRQFQMRKELEALGYTEKDNIRFMIGDVRDRDRLRRAMQGIDVVVHAAALKRIEVGHYNPIEMVKTNVGGAINVIEAAQDAGVKKVIALSSDKAFQPVSAYGTSKALAESLFLAANNTSGWNGPRFAACRYGNVWKSTGSVVPVWSKILETSKKVPVTDPDCTRFFMTMDEAVDLVLNTVATMEGGELAIPNLPAYRLGDLATAMGAEELDITGLPEWEKKHESMGNNNSSDAARRMSVEELKEALKNY